MTTGKWFSHDSELWSSLHSPETSLGRLDTQVKAKEIRRVTLLLKSGRSTRWCWTFLTSRAANGRANKCWTRKLWELGPMKWSIDRDGCPVSLIVLNQFPSKYCSQSTVHIVPIILKSVEIYLFNVARNCESSHVWLTKKKANFVFPLNTLQPTLQERVLMVPSGLNWEGRTGQLKFLLKYSMFAVRPWMDAWDKVTACDNALQDANMGWVWDPWTWQDEGSNLGRVKKTSTYSTHHGNMLGTLAQRTIPSPHRPAPEHVVVTELSMGIWQPTSSTWIQENSGVCCKFFPNKNLRLQFAWSLHTWWLRHLSQQDACWVIHGDTILCCHLWKVIQAISLLIDPISIRSWWFAGLTGDIWPHQFENLEITVSRPMAPTLAFLTFKGGCFFRKRFCTVHPSW